MRVVDERQKLALARGRPAGLRLGLEQDESRERRLRSLLQSSLARSHAAMMMMMMVMRGQSFGCPVREGEEDMRSSRLLLLLPLMPGLALSKRGGPRGAFARARGLGLGLGLRMGWGWGWGDGDPRGGH